MSRIWWSWWHHPGCSTLRGSFLFISAMQNNTTFSWDDPAPCLKLFFQWMYLSWHLEHIDFLHWNSGFIKRLYGKASQRLLAWFYQFTATLMQVYMIYVHFTPQVSMISDHFTLHVFKLSTMWMLFPSYAGAQDGQFFSTTCVVDSEQGETWVYRRLSLVDLFEKKKKIRGNPFFSFQMH